MSKKDKILKLYNQGLSYSQIAKELHVSKPLVGFYVRASNIADKAQEQQEKEEKKKYYEQLVCYGVSKAHNFNQLCTFLNKHATNTVIDSLKKIIDKHQIDISHFSNEGLKRKPQKKYTFDEIFKENSTYTPSKLLNKLLYYGVKERKCENCGKVTAIYQGQEYPIPLQVHHINGDRKDHRIENLEILCPTCHALTDNYAGKNIKKTKKQVLPRISKPHPTKRPLKEQLIEDYREYGGFSGVGRKYGVSDNAVKKWFKYYGLPSTAKEIRQMIVQKFGKQKHWYASRRATNFERVIEKLGKPVIMIDENSQTVEFRSITEASQATNISKSTIARMCNGIKTKVKNIDFKFKYEQQKKNKQKIQ